jgi:hypothetical protein
VSTTVTPPPVEALDAGVIEDARRRQRRQRRRAAIGLLVIALLGGLAAVVALAISGKSSPAASDAATPGGLRTGALAALHVAGPLAVGPSGALYVADVARERILVRLSDGRFRVVAGDGKVGFAGDGGPAVEAELSRVSDLAFSASGSLYVADDGRVRVIGRDGTIRTIAGDGRYSPLVKSGTPALSAGLGSVHSIAVSGTGLSIAFSAAGQLYISTGYQVLRLTSGGTLTTVRAVVTSGPQRGSLRSSGPVAMDRRGDIDLAGAFTGWSIWQVTPNGVAHEVGFARRSGGDYATLERGPNGAVYGEDGSTIVRVAGHRLVPAFTFGMPVRGESFPLTYFVFGPHGTIYADDYPGGTAFEAHQQLVSVRNARVSSLWQEKNAAPK